MPTINEILNFSFSAAAFQQSGKNSISLTTIRLHEARINKLKQITESIGESSFKFTGETMIPHVFKKFVTAISTSKYQLTTINNFDRRELKTLAYCLDYSESNLLPILSSLPQLTITLNTLERNWKDGFLFGLIRCYLKSWETNHIYTSERLGQFIITKLKNYEGGRTALKSLKDNIKYFDNKNGNVILGSELALKNKSIKEATKYLSLPESWFSYPYFSKVIVAYYEKKRNNIQQVFDDLHNALQEHKNSISNKRVISKLIIQANAYEFAILQDKVKSIAVKLVGDPGQASHWTVFENASETEKEDLKTARNILNEWITRQFINVFFEKCINDSRRKRFWLKYAKEITQFRVVGSSYIKRILLSDNRITEYVLPRFSNTNSSRDSNAALMFIIKNHLFIEFSDEGAFYAYKLTNANAPSIDKEYFYSTNDLKLTHLLQLVDRKGYYITWMGEEGKLPHRDGIMVWEDVAAYWLINKAGIHV